MLLGSYREVHNFLWAHNWWLNTVTGEHVNFDVLLDIIDDLPGDQYGVEAGYDGLVIQGVRYTPL